VIKQSAVDAAAIGFKLGFAGSASTDAASELRHLDTVSGEPGQHVLELRQFHLQLAFAGPRVTGEDIEDELRAIDTAAVNLAFEVAELRGAELVIEDDDVGIGGGGGSRDLFHFALADERGGIGFVAALQNLTDHFGSGAEGEFVKLGKRFVGAKASDPVSGNFGGSAGCTSVSKLW